jgi:hypothetical protein
MNTVTDMSNMAYVIVKESVNIRILNVFSSDSIVIMGIPVIPKGTHLHAFQHLPQLAYDLVAPCAKTPEIRLSKEPLIA